MRECETCSHKDDLKKDDGSYLSYIIHFGNYIVAARSPECEQCDILKKWIESIKEQCK